MRLYKMELYKLLYRKIFRISMPAVLGILFAYFLLICVGEERSTINGSLYTGFEAIRRDREITEEFRGILTDEKAGRIIEEYGFPSQVIENYGGFRDENYLNGFVTEYLGNGYLKSWDDYRISTGLRPLRCFRKSSRAGWLRCFLQAGKEERRTLLRRQPQRLQRQR